MVVWAAALLSLLTGTQALGLENGRPPAAVARLECLKCCEEPLPDGTCCCHVTGCPVVPLPPSCPPPPVTAGLEPWQSWTNPHGGPIQRDALAERMSASPPSGPTPTPTTASAPGVAAARPPPPGPAPVPAGAFKFDYHVGALAAGDDIAIINVTSEAEALAACTALIACHGVTYIGGPNGTITAKPTKAYLKHGSHVNNGQPSDHMWSSWTKVAPFGPPAQVLAAEGLNLALRADSFTVQWLNVTGVSNYSFVNSLDGQSALPLSQHLGDVSLRLRRAAGPGPAEGHSAEPWAYFASAWGPFTATAKPVTPLPSGTLAAHDITALLEATNVSHLDGAAVGSLPLKVVRRSSSGLDV